MIKNRQLVLNGYRKLLKKCSQTFAGDNEALVQSKIQLRESFDVNKNVQDENKIAKMLQDIEEADDMLSHIVQAKLTEDGNYGVSLPNPKPVSSSIDSPNSILP